MNSASTVSSHHTFTDALRSFHQCYPHTATVVDVGVQGITQPLVDVFPHCHHILFEPVLAYNHSIDISYSNISHELISKAVSDSPGQLFQHVYSMDRSGSPTHSFLSDNQFPENSLTEFLLHTLSTPVVTLDQELARLIHHEPYSFLVKIDIDGLDTAVMHGMSALAQHCSLLIVECPINKIAERVVLADKLGFDVYDVTSPGYYHNKLSQLDFFFLNRNLKSLVEDFSPWRKYGPEVQWDFWKHLD